ncbi:MAG: hypothetical protein EOO73_03140 [Myxococcales bacterium]|nr:MAG: hypothetical protein EOO73_03140 [Myxococcales bacterium]
MTLPPFVSPFAASPMALRRHVFDEGEQRVDCGSALMVTPKSAELPLEGDDFGFSAAQTEQFLAGGPLTLGWITQSPGARGNESVYVYCWVTIGD